LIQGLREPPANISIQRLPGPKGHEEISRWRKPPVAHGKDKAAPDGAMRRFELETKIFRRPAGADDRDNVNRWLAPPANFPSGLRPEKLKRFSPGFELRKFNVF